MDLRLLSFCLFLTAALAAQASGFKKWVDENGQVHYGAAVPPQYIDQEHSELNARGLEIHRTERAPTAEEIAEQQALERLRAQAQRAAAEQRARDRLLLNMYRTESDLLAIRDGKIQQLDAQISSKKTQIERLKKRLSQWQERAAAAERRGRKLTPKQQENLDATQRQIESAYEQVAEKQSDRQDLNEHYARELRRFRELKGIDNQADADQDASTQGDVAIPGRFTCSSIAHCDHLWGIAKAYVREHADTGIEISGARIYMTKPPELAQQLALSVTRLSSHGKEQLFLDAQCHPSANGRALCESERVRKIRSAFNADLLRY